MTLYFLCVGHSHRNRKKNEETSYGEHENKMGFYVQAYSRWGWVAVTLKKTKQKKDGTLLHIANNLFFNLYVESII